MIERFAQFARGVARDLGGEVSVVADDDWPSAGIVFAKHHVVLLRDHQTSLSVSLPTEGSWHLRSAADWPKVVPEIRSAVTDYRARHPNAVTLADAVVALRSVLDRFDVSFPGVPIPTECWLKKGQQSVGIFQRSGAIQVVVWVGSSMRSQSCSSLESFAPLGPWLERELHEQANALAAEAAEKARRAALPVPSLREVLEALARGERFSVGGGRWSETYFIEAGKLRRTVFDEGHTETLAGTERELERTIGQYPDAFRKS